MTAFFTIILASLTPSVRSVQGPGHLIVWWSGSGNPDPLLVLAENVSSCSIIIYTLELQKGVRIFREKKKNGQNLLSKQFC